MNLIKQLGGYDKAKWWEHHLIQAEKKGIHHNRGNSALLFTLRELQTKLLEYRRENSIFEVGDKVVHIDIYPQFNNVWEYDGDGVKTIINPYMIRHATDAEIKAGHRI